jgi:cytochrome c oxidase assembly protein subunit 11
MTRQPEPSSDVRTANNRLLRRLLLVTVVMFGFGFALVPIYSVFCKITGLNGKTGRVDAQQVQAMHVDESRWVTVEFTTSVNQGMPWEFRARQTRIRVHPGAINKVVFHVRNTADEAITGQAIPSLVPGLAAAHFKKLECFCFDRQTLKAGEEKDMPVRFVVEPELARDVETVTLAYTFFNVDAASAKKYSDVTPLATQQTQKAVAQPAQAAVAIQ